MIDVPLSTVSFRQVYWLNHKCSNSKTMFLLQRNILSAPVPKWKIYCNSFSILNMTLEKTSTSLYMQITESQNVMLQLKLVSYLSLLRSIYLFVTALTKSQEKSFTNCFIYFTVGKTIDHVPSFYCICKYNSMR